MHATLHSRETAPIAARDTIDQFVGAWGFLPNLGAAMAASPAALAMLWAAYGALTSHATLSPAEQQLVCVAASRVNECEYCVAAHSTLAAGAGLGSATLERVRDGQSLPDARAEALRMAAIRLVQQRGWLSDAERADFARAGLGQGELIEVVAWVALKTLTNYTNHLARTPLDEQWQAQRWDKPRR